MTNDPSGAGYYSGPGAPAADEWSVSITDDDQRTMTSEQVVQEYQRGTLDLEDTFVWREGMDDWVPLGESGELMAFIGQIASQPGFSNPGVNEGLGQTVALGDPAGDAHVDAGAGGVAIFGDRESHPGPPRPGSKRLGERGEASSLFSLDDIQKAAGARPPGRKSDRSSSSEPADSLMGLGSGFGGGFDSSAFAATPDLLHAPPPPPPEPPKPVVPEMPASLMVPPSSYAMPAQKSRVPLIIAAFAGIVVISAVTVYFLARGPSEESVAAVSTSDTGDDESGAGSDDDKKTDDDKSDDDKKTDDDKSDDDKKTDDDKSDDDKSDDDKVGSGKLPPGVAPGTPGSTKDDDKKGDDKKGDDKKDDDKKDDDKKDEGSGKEFNRDAARAALSGAAGAASGCKRPGGPTGRGRVSVTFAPSGRATSAVVGPPFAGTKTGSCAARAFRSASVPPFSGGPVTVSKSFTIR